jgi:hypothetical protein
MAAVLPAAARLASLQQDCRRNLPVALQGCRVLKLEDGALTVSAPNAAAAARLKQTLPSLQEKLNQSGWSIESMRVKVQMTATHEKPATPVKKPLPSQALASLAELHQHIAQSGNQELTAALATMLKRHRK